MSISESLVQWYKHNKRYLPFRATKDAYKIWLSEIILQQTRVEQGLPYYNRFVERFPDVFSLAAAQEEEVLKLWQGLGYYSRGRNLHHAANEVVTTWQGKFPKEYDDLLKLKGVGSYTAAAIASFAFKKPHAVVDGNVMRVLSRLYAVKKAVNSTEGRKLMDELADEILDKATPDLHNYAIMELGALICKPQNPVCSECPVSLYCEAFRLNKQNHFPVKEKKTVVQNRYMFYVVMLHKDKTYIRKRTANGIWKNLYDFPLIETVTRKPIRQIVQSKSFKEFFDDDAYKLKTVSDEYKHVLSHRNLFAVFVEVHLNKALSKNKSDGLIAVTLDELKSKYALPRLIEKFVEEEF